MIASPEVSNVDQVGLVCNEYYGRCWRTQRYVLRYYYDPSYFPGRGYNYYAGPGYFAATATADQGSPFAAGSPLDLPVPPSPLAPAEEVIE